MFNDTSWVKNTAPSETTTITFLNSKGFIFHQHRVNQENILQVDEQLFEGQWCESILPSQDSEREQRLLQLTVTHISTNEENPTSTTLTDVYRHDLLDFMQRNHRIQTQIRKALNAQHSQLERLEMEIARPGHAKALRTKIATFKPVMFQEQSDAKITLCTCSTKKNNTNKTMWWCTQCRTTECPQCTKSTCYRGLDSDLKQQQRDEELINAKITMQETTENKSCREISHPEFYVCKVIDFKAGWRIQTSSTVMKQFR